MTIGGNGMESCKATALMLELVGAVGAQHVLSSLRELGMASARND